MKVLFVDGGQHIPVVVPKLIERASAMAMQGHKVGMDPTSRANRLRVFMSGRIRYVEADNLFRGHLRAG